MLTGCAPSFARSTAGPAAVPAAVIREGKVPAAWFLEQVGGKGMRRGDVQVASYHANLLYNDGAATAADIIDLAAVGFFAMVTAALTAVGYYLLRREKEGVAIDDVVTVFD